MKNKEAELILKRRKIKFKELLKYLNKNSILELQSLLDSAGENNVFFFYGERYGHYCSSIIEKIILEKRLQKLNKI